MSNPLAAVPMRWVSVTPVVLNNDAYDANDVIFDTTLIEGACGGIDQPTTLQSIVYQDLSDQTAANLTFFFLRSNVVFGVKDAAPSIVDADAPSLQGVVPFASTLILDVTDSKVGSLHNIGLTLMPETGTRRVYVAMTSAGTPTHATGCILLKFGFKDG